MEISAVITAISKDESLLEKLFDEKFQNLTRARTACVGYVNKRKPEVARWTYFDVNGYDSTNCPQGYPYPYDEYSVVWEKELTQFASFLGSRGCVIIYFSSPDFPDYSVYGITTSDGSYEVFDGSLNELEERLIKNYPDDDYCEIYMRKSDAYMDFWERDDRSTVQNESDSSDQINDDIEITDEEMDRALDVLDFLLDTLEKDDKESEETVEKESNSELFDAGETLVPAVEYKSNPAAVQSVGSYVLFGRYPQTAEGNDKTPIEWLVLDYDAKNHRSLLLSRYGLEAKRYRDTYKIDTWETSEARNWLNNIFLNEAFNTDEQSIIMLTSVDNSHIQGRSDWNSIAENNTKDKVFLLSYSEARKYFGTKSYDERQGEEVNTASCMAPTAYAAKRGANPDKQYKTVDGKPTASWWLRSPGAEECFHATVWNDGLLTCDDELLNSICFRPAIWLDLEPCKPEEQKSTHAIEKSRTEIESYEQRAQAMTEIFRQIKILEEQRDSVNSVKNSSMQKQIDELMGQLNQLMGN